MRHIEEKQNCCGCTACAAACRPGSIHMEADAEGFLYPVYQGDTCVGCGACLKACPMPHPPLAKLVGGHTAGQQGAAVTLKSPALAPVAEAKAGYLAQNRGDITRAQSTSGGAFTAIAEDTIDRGGVVFGAAFDDELRVRHSPCTTVQGLAAFRNSKYVQSEMGSSYRQVRAFLEAGRPVCFSGTPCQVAGLKGYLGRDHEALVLVDVVCRAVPSPLVWEKYLQMQRDRLAPRAVGRAQFRHKYYGYAYSNLTLFEAGTDRVLYHRGVESDPMLRAFFGGYSTRPCCHSCPFKCGARPGDITLWDCLDIDSLYPPMNDNRGTTKVLLHSGKAVALFQRLEGRLNCHSVAVERLVATNSAELYRSPPASPLREAFFTDLAHLPPADLFGKYFPDTLTVKLKRAARVLLCKLGATQQAKRLLRAVRRRGGA